MTDTGNDADRLVLGTAQLGMAYGIANRAGKPDPCQAAEIVKAAWDSGIREFDTAQGYGNSESILGSVITNMGIERKIRIITKPHPHLNHLDVGLMRTALEASLRELRVPTLYGYMLHKESLLDLWGQGLANIMSDFVNEGLVERIGASVYHPEKAVEALQSDGIHFVQVPTNFLDRRFLKAGVFELARELGKRIYIRSAFLQGLVLMHKDQLPAHMSGFKPLIESIERFCENHGINKCILALAYLRKAYPGVGVAFGAETATQVKKNVRCWEADLSEEIVAAIEKEFNVEDETILNPSLWPK